MVITTILCILNFRIKLNLDIIVNNNTLVYYQQLTPTRTNQNLLKHLSTKSFRGVFIINFE